MTIQLDLQGITVPLRMEISFIVMIQSPPYRIHFVHGVNLNYSSALVKAILCRQM